MSSTKRGGKRSPADNYPTPSWTVRRLLEMCPIPSGHWLEPCAGNGAIITAVNDVIPGLKWDAVELRDTSAELTQIKNVSTCWAPQSFLDPVAGISHYSVAFTNPPFSLAEDFIGKCLTLADYTVMLLRLNFLGGKKRADWLRCNPPDVYVLPNRPSFTANGKTDSCEYAWFVWHRNLTHGKIQVLATSPASERRRG